LLIKKNENVKQSKRNTSAKKNKTKTEKQKDKKIVLLSRHLFIFLYQRKGCFRDKISHYNIKYNNNTLYKSSLQILKRITNFAKIQFRIFLVSINIHEKCNYLKKTTACLS